MTPKQVLAYLTQEQIEDLLTECCFSLDVIRIGNALIRGLTEEELKLCNSIISTHISSNEDEEFDWPIL